MRAENAATSVERAASSAEEFEFLRAIGAELGKEFPRLIYADWLEERGDGRAGFVRELTAAAKALGEGAGFPEAGAWPRAWVNMLGAPLWEGLAELDLREVKEEVLAVARPILTIETEQVDEERIPVGGGKFGGLPDLPGDVAWPTCEGGPLGFLGQINLAELQLTQAGRELSQDGLLSFFAFQSDDGYQPGMQEYAGDTQVLYTPASRALERRSPPADVTLGKYSFGPFRSCRLSLCETWDLPDPRDVVPPELAAATERLKQFEEARRKWPLHDLRGKCRRFGHHLLGYSIHFRTDDPSPGPPWRPLLCLESDDNLGWNWCDGEHLAIWVHEDDLRDRTFQRVYGYAS